MSFVTLFLLNNLWYNFLKFLIFFFLVNYQTYFYTLVLFGFMLINIGSEFSPDNHYYVVKAGDLPGQSGYKSY